MTSSQPRTLAGDHLGSAPSMSIQSLSERVIAARAAKRMKAAQLQRASGLSARTIRDIEQGNHSRRYSPATLAALDGPLGWETGTAWSIYLDESAGDTSHVEAELGELRRRLVMLEEEPPWSRELVGYVRLLTPADRARVFDLARRLSES